MVTTRIAFGAASTPVLLAAILLAVAAVLLGWGVRQLTRRRWEYAAVCIGASLGPLVGAPLAAAALTARYAPVGKDGRIVAWIGGGVVAAGLVVAAIVYDFLVPARPGGWMVLLGAEVMLAVGVFYAAVYSYLGLRRTAVLVAFRAAAVLALLAALFKPALSRTFTPAAAAGRPYVAILIDRSASMATQDAGDETRGGGAEKQSRYRFALDAVARQAPRLGDACRLAWYHFARAAQAADAPESLQRFTPSGEDAGYTDIRKAFVTVRQNLLPDELAAVLVVSDCVYNPVQPDGEARELLAAAGRLRAPIYVATVGSAHGQAGLRDKGVRIDSATVSPPIVMKDNVATVKVTLSVAALSRVPVKVSLYEGDGRTEVDSKEVWTHKDAAELDADLKWTPRQRPGGDAATGADIRRLRVEAAAQADEKQKDDNSASVNVLVTQPRIRVLYVEGTIRPEYKFLRRLFDTDPNVQFMSLVRVSEGTFWAYGGVEGRRLAGLPTSEQDFKLFDVLILGDLDQTFLSGSQMARIRQFVSNGGGLLMLGGHSSFGAGGYGGSEIEQALPVLAGGRNQPQERTPFVPKLTAGGRGHPVLEGVTGYFVQPDGRPGEAGPLPDLLGCVAVVRAKPAADVLLVHPSRNNEDGPLVVLAVQPYGVGRSAAFTADTTWRWFRELSAAGEGPYERFWGQLIRWLAGTDTRSRDAAASVLLQLDPSRTAFAPGQKVTVIVTARGAKADEAQASVTCRLVPAEGGKPQTLDLKPVEGKGKFQAVLTPERPGRYRLDAEARDKDRKIIAADSLPLVVPAVEDSALAAETDPARLKPDRELADRIASQSGGEHREISQLPELIERILARSGGEQGPRARTTVFPAYGSGTMSALFAVFVVLLTCEWLIRRNWQLH